MIPLLITIIVVLLTSTLNIDPNAKFLTLSVVFFLTLWQVNVINLKFLKTEILVKIIFVNNKDVKINEFFVYIYKEKFNKENVTIKKNKSIYNNLTENKIAVTLRAERIKKSKHLNIFLTFPSIWFDKYNKWRYKPYLGNIIIYKKHKK